MILQTSGKVSFYYNSEDGSQEAKTNAAVFPDGATSWTHIAVVMDATVEGAGGMKVYVNGVVTELDATANGDTTGITSASWTSAQNVFIGAENSDGAPGGYFDGILDDIIFYDVALTGAEIAILHDVGYAGSIQLDTWGHTTDGTLIDGGKIYTGSISADKIAANAITADKIAAKTITADEIFAGTITSSELGNNSVINTAIADDSTQVYEVANTASYGALGDTNYHEVQSDSIDGLGGVIELRGACTFDYTGGSSGSTTVYLRLMNGATEIKEVSGTFAYDVAGVKEFRLSISDIWWPEGSGSVTIDLDAKCDTSPGFSVTESDMILIESRGK